MCTHSKGHSRHRGSKWLETSSSHRGSCISKGRWSTIHQDSYTLSYVSWNIQNPGTWHYGTNLNKWRGFLVLYILSKRLQSWGRRQKSKRIQQDLREKRGTCVSQCPDWREAVKIRPGWHQCKNRQRYSGNKTEPRNRALQSQSAGPWEENRGFHEKGRVSHHREREKLQEKRESRPKS